MTITKQQLATLSTDELRRVAKMANTLLYSRPEYHNINKLGFKQYSELRMELWENIKLAIERFHNSTKEDIKIWSYNRALCSTMLNNIGFFYISVSVNDIMSQR